MKKLLDIIEGLKIGSKTKIGGYNPDELNGDHIKIYDSDDGEDENDKDAFWEDFESWMDNIEKNYDGFIFCKFKSLSQSKNLDNDIFEYSTNLSDVIKDKIITGNDYGYEVRLVQGHIEIDCINSGSRGDYYIYALSEEIYDNVKMWFEGDLDDDDEIKDLSFLLEKGNIIPIEDK